MATIDELLERKSIRVFQDKEIPQDVKDKILKAAVNAPTAGNMQLYTIIDVTDQSIKEELVKTCDNQPFIKDAKMVLVFCADYNKWYKAFESTNCNPRHLEEGDLMLAVSDTNIAAQNAVTAAWSLGVGSCYIGDVMENYEKQKELLHLPRYVFPAAMVVFGYPEEKQMNRKKPKRAPMDLIVHENHYKDFTNEDLERLFYDETKFGGYEKWMNAFCTRKYNSNFSKEMSRSVRKYLEEYSNK